MTAVDWSTVCSIRTDVSSLSLRHGREGALAILRDIRRSMHRQLRAAGAEGKVAFIIHAPWLGMYPDLLTVIGITGLPPDVLRLLRDLHHGHGRLTG